ncbi:MAG: PLP-dependent aminotransferase family protein, partial [Planctomycetales bacterium]
VDYFDNPCNVTLSAERRGEIVELAKRWSQHGAIHVIEDSAYRELRYEGDDVPSLRSFDPEGDTVIVAQTFSKSFSPGLRVGWGILPPSLVEPVCALKGNVDFGSPNFAQHVMSAVFEEGLFEGQVETLRDEYRRKMNAMLDAADEFLAPLPGTRWRRPSGGLYVWLELPESLDAGPDGLLFDLALQEGMLYVPGHYCYPEEGRPVSRNTIRLSFGAQSPERIRQGVEALARAVRRALNA